MWYTLSAWWFSEVYVWSAPGEARLWWVDYGRPYERARLNERPIYLRTMFLCLAITQSFFHLCWDYDRVPLVAKSPKSFHQPLLWIKGMGPKILHNAISRTVFCGLTGSLLYLLFVRHLAWNLTFSLVSNFYTLQKSQRPPVIGGLVDMVGRFLVEGFFLELLWEFCNAIFADHVADEPLKRYQPLTNDSSDPNGSLLQGLRGKKEVPRVSFPRYRNCERILTNPGIRLLGARRHCHPLRWPPQSLVHRIGLQTICDRHGNNGKELNR